jgi:hypothetical protein
VGVLIVGCTQALLLFDLAFTGLPNGIAACYDKCHNKFPIKQIERFPYEFKVCFFTVFVERYFY